jgi:hypothetical protein
MNYRDLTLTNVLEFVYMKFILYFELSHIIYIPFFNDSANLMVVFVGIASNS